MAPGQNWIQSKNIAGVDGGGGHRQAVVVSDTILSNVKVILCVFFSCYTLGGGGISGSGDGGGDAGKRDLDVMTCTAVNHVHRRAVRFDLKIPHEEDVGDFAYRATGNTHLLPEYMQVR